MGAFIDAYMITGHNSITVWLAQARLYNTQSMHGRLWLKVHLHCRVNPVFNPPHNVGEQHQRTREQPEKNIFLVGTELLSCDRAEFFEIPRVSKEQESFYRHGYNERM